MLNHAIKTTKGQMDQIMKHIKKIVPQPKTTAGKPDAKSMGPTGACIPVGD